MHNFYLIDFGIIFGRTENIDISIPKSGSIRKIVVWAWLKLLFLGDFLEGLTLCCQNLRLFIINDEIDDTLVHVA